MKLAFALTAFAVALAYLGYLLLGPFGRGGRGAKGRLTIRRG
jgi:hypothetical protein